ncbi:MAG: DNA-directed RNA polymerase subunit alpha [Prevotellaceae bacterium]|jgi:DNA-directed RNA polymerase subunit alpha|nr:DNA-directed RNA polymerase subunit alpha [Prevotellaceae bacterium]
MAILAFQKPDKVILLESTETFGRFEFRPLEPGYGITVGNALRRILLSSLEGFAITTVKITGVDHEFATIPGVIENMVDIILNLKQIRFKQMVDGIDGEKIQMTFMNREKITAGDLAKQISSFKVLNPDLLVCQLDPTVKLQIECTVGKGRGYVPAEENKPEDAPFGLIPIDSLFTPIKNVKYSVENWRVEQKTDYEKLTLEITTDGSIHPAEALKEAARILIFHFMLFSDERITIDTTDDHHSEEFDEETLRMRNLLMTKLADLELSVRALNCLKTADIETLGELAKLERSELLKFRNFGRKSLTELDALLDRVKLSFGMDVEKYRLEVKNRAEKE